MMSHLQCKQGKHVVVRPRSFQSKEQLLGKRSISVQYSLGVSRCAGTCSRQRRSCRVMMMRQAVTH
jgi:hypothetical protein